MHEITNITSNQLIYFYMSIYQEIFSLPALFLALVSQALIQIVAACAWIKYTVLH
jgi:hypothetical protein